jgi:hypothetical protein
MGAADRFWGAHRSVAWLGRAAWEVTVGRACASLIENLVLTVVTTPPQLLALPVGQITPSGGPVPRAKIFCFAIAPNQHYNSRYPVPHEGRWPSSRTLGWDAVDAAASGALWIRRADFVSVSEQPARQTNGAEAYGKTVWFWHPLLVSSRRRRRQPNRA